jgi:hypothetical protein
MGKRVFTGWKGETGERGPNGQCEKVVCGDLTIDYYQEEDYEEPPKRKKTGELTGDEAEKEIC